MISVAHDHNPARKLWMLVDRDLKDISDTDTIVRWRNWLRLFLCAQSPPAKHGGNQEYCAEPNPKGLRFKHQNFFPTLMDHDTPARTGIPRFLSCAFGTHGIARQYSPRSIAPTPA